MTESNPNAASLAGREIVSTRVLNAPRELAFRAFSEREHFAQWWGPKGFRNTLHDFDFRPGARWHITLHGPDGTDYKNEYVLLEVVEPERIVISHPDPKHNFQVTIILAEEGEMTRLTWRMRFESTEHCDEVKPFVIEGNEQNLDRLEAELAKMRAAP
jgi:uncharacterized protein YndB with AHSA1/START domain